MSNCTDKVIELAVSESPLGSKGQGPSRKESYRTERLKLVCQENARRATPKQPDLQGRETCDDTLGATSMDNMIRLRAVRNVQMGITNTAVIVGEDISGRQIEVTFRLVDIPAVVVLLLCCAAAGAATLPAPGTIVPQGHLPVMEWETGQSEINHKPLLVLRLLGGCVLTFEFEGATAIECGEALIREGNFAELTPR